MAFNLLIPQFDPSPAGGMQLLGIGEAIRSFVLLLGVVFVLGDARKLLMVMGLALLPTALMAVLGMMIQETVTGVLPRLATGGTAYLLCLALAIGILMPGMAGAALRQLRRTLKMKGEPS
jgi:putative peptidoglycan lipid II flippase